MMSRRLWYILLSVAALAVGGLMYVVFREETYVGRLFDGVALVEEIRKTTKSVFAVRLSAYLADYLWGFSLGCGLCAIFDGGVRSAARCGLAVIVCGAAWEIMQAFGVLSGTGDFWDIVMYLLAAVAVVIISMIGEKKR